ncbi:hypothetical protein CI102_4772 [Trichoderma harzianum]|nr:hypothetical protein CI102_4772 [Trichoderma harzianum]
MMKSRFLTISGILMRMLLRVPWIVPRYLGLSLPTTSILLALNSLGGHINLIRVFLPSSFTVEARAVLELIGKHRHSHEATPDYNVTPWHITYIATPQRTLRWIVISSSRLTRSSQSHVNLQATRTRRG